MAKGSEAIFWPVKFGLAQTRRLGNFSVETAKAITRKQVDLGQAVLRTLDPSEFVSYRKREAEDRETRRREMDKLGKDLRDHDPTDPNYPKLVRFSVPSMLKLMDQWKADGSPVSKDGIEQAERFLRDNNVPAEFITAALEELPREKNLAELASEIPSQPGETVSSPS